MMTNGILMFSTSPGALHEYTKAIANLYSGVSLLSITEFRYNTVEPPIPAPQKREKMRVPISVT